MAVSIGAGLHASTWAHLATPGGAPAGWRAGGACGALLHGRADGGGALLSGDDDARRRADADAGAGACRGVAAADPVADLRWRVPARRAEGRRDHRHGADGKAGRHGRAREHDRGPAGRYRGGGRASPDRPQVVHVRADVGCLPDDRADRCRADVLPGAARLARWNHERREAAAAERQARQPLERLIGGRAGWRTRLARRRGRARHSRDHRNGDGNAARLRRQLGRLDAQRAGPGAPSRAPPDRFPETARRPAADGARAGGHGAGRGGSHRARLPASAQL